ncbi:hypothetical protein JL721_7295 [Aureococcus anophagefferens]|nr:hypothetical protein JL721_7295 [Aureococcus anophagefferens]
MARAQPARHGGSPVYLALFNLIVGCFSFVGIIVLISVGYWLGPVWNFMLLACLIASLAHVVVVAQGVCRPEREARRVQARVANAVFAITALMAIAAVNASADAMALHSCALRVRCDAVHATSELCGRRVDAYLRCHGPSRSQHGDRRLEGADEGVDLSEASLYYWVHDDCTETGGGADRACAAFESKEACVDHRFVDDARQDDDDDDCAPGESPRELAGAMARATLVLLAPVAVAVAHTAAWTGPRFAHVAPVVAEALPVAVPCGGESADAPPARRGGIRWTIQASTPSASTLRSSPSQASTPLAGSRAPA